MLRTFTFFSPSCSSAGSTSLSISLHASLPVRRESLLRRLVLGRIPLLALLTRGRVLRFQPVKESLLAARTRLLAGLDQLLGPTLLRRFSSPSLTMKPCRSLS